MRCLCRLQQSRPAAALFDTAPLAAILATLLLAGCTTLPPAPSPPTPIPAPEPQPDLTAPSADRTFAVLAINDVYRIEGVEDGARGGLARVRTLRAELEERYPDLLLLHAGDFLFPSFASRTFRGAQMIDVMNLLDGDASRFDERMFVTFGNHEFDKGGLDDAPMLDARIEESAFHWLGSNVEFVAGADGLPVVRAHNLGRTALRDAGGVRVGIFSLTTGVAQPEYVAGFDPLLETARAETRSLREAGAEVVIALTHLEAQQDVDLMRRLCEPVGEEGGTDPGCPDLLLGGHDHDAQALEVENRWVLKADADAVSAQVAEITLPGDGGPPRVEHHLEPLGADVEPDPAVAAVAASWSRRHDHLFCSAMDAPDGCLAEPLGRTRVPLVAEELAIRRYETNLGDWVADLMLSAFDEPDERRAAPPRGRYLEAPPSQPARQPDSRPLVAFINSGSLRLNQDLPPGVVTRQDVEELFAYPTPLVLLEIDGRTLRRVANRAVEGWTGNGWWLQIAGWAFRHDPQAGAATDLTLLTADGPRPLRDSDRLLAVTGRYLVDPKIGDQDGYTMLSPQQILVGRGDLKQIVIEALRQAGDDGIAPRVQGRICNPLREGACLAVAP